MELDEALGIAAYLRKLCDMDRTADENSIEERKHQAVLVLAAEVERLRAIEARAREVAADPKGRAWWEALAAARFILGAGGAQ